MPKELSQFMGLDLDQIIRKKLCENQLNIKTILNKEPLAIILQQDPNTVLDNLYFNLVQTLQFIDVLKTLKQNE